MIKDFCKKVKNILQEKIQGEIDVWYTYSTDELYIKIVNNDIYWGYAIHNLSNTIIIESNFNKIIIDIIKKYEKCVLSKYFKV